MLPDLTNTIQTAILTIVSLPPFLAGWVAGFMVRSALWFVAAVLAGYEMGRGK